MLKAKNNNNNNNNNKKEKSCLRETGHKGANFVAPAQDRVQWRGYANTVMNLRVP
jgi:hypothetical protein